MKFEYAETLYRTETEAADALLLDWVTCKGSESKKDAIDYMAKLTNQEIARECIEAWGDGGGDGVSEDALASAAKRLRHVWIAERIQR